MNDRDDDATDPQEEGFLSYDPELWDMTAKKEGWWRIDPSKIKTVQDIVMILHAINIKFVNTHPDFDKISHLLKEEK